MMIEYGFIALTMFMAVLIVFAFRETQKRMGVSQKTLTSRTLAVAFGVAAWLS